MCLSKLLWGIIIVTRKCKMSIETHCIIFWGSIDYLGEQWRKEFALKINTPWELTECKKRHCCRSLWRSGFLIQLCNRDHSSIEIQATCNGELSQNFLKAFRGKNRDAETHGCFGKWFIFINLTDIYQFVTDTNIGARYTTELAFVFFFF